MFTLRDITTKANLDTEIWNEEMNQIETVLWWLLAINVKLEYNK